MVRLSEPTESVTHDHTALVDSDLGGPTPTSNSSSFSNTDRPRMEQGGHHSGLRHVGLGGECQLHHRRCQFPHVGACGSARHRVTSREGLDHRLPAHRPAVPQIEGLDTLVQQRLDVAFVLRQGGVEVVRSRLLGS